MAEGPDKGGAIEHAFQAGLSGIVRGSARHAWAVVGIVALLTVGSVAVLLTVEPNVETDIQAGYFATYDDHRLATAAAVIGLAVPGVQIVNVDTTAKTLPGSMCRLGPDLSIVASERSSLYRRHVTFASRAETA